MKSTVWRLRTGNTEEYIYRLQCNDVHIKSEKKLFETVNDWKFVGECWPIKDNNKDYIFQKQFNSEEEFKKWSSLFIWDLQILSSTSDTIKKIKRIAKTKVAKRGRPKKRKPTQCKKCGKLGHNARTCGR